MNDIQIPDYTLEGIKNLKNKFPEFKKDDEYHIIKNRVRKFYIDNINSRYNRDKRFNADMINPVLSDSWKLALAISHSGSIDLGFGGVTFTMPFLPFDLYEDLLKLNIYILENMDTSISPTVFTEFNVDEKWYKNTNYLIQVSENEYNISYETMKHHINRLYAGYQLRNGSIPYLGVVYPKWDWDDHKCIHKLQIVMSGIFLNKK